MRYQGKLTSWNDASGFGFITGDGGGQPIFIHVSALPRGRRRPLGNDILSYELEIDQQGRPRAIKAAYASGSGRHSSLPAFSFPIAFACAFLALLGAAAWAEIFPPAVFYLYLGASLLAFIAYWKDKSAARQQRWRTAESTLHLFGLIGGWPGALLAQHALRHKCRKPSFQYVYYVTVVFNCGALLVYASPAASRWLQALLLTGFT